MISIVFSSWLITEKQSRAIRRCVSLLEFVCLYIYLLLLAVDWIADKDTQVTYDDCLMYAGMQSRDSPARYSPQYSPSLSRHPRFQFFHLSHNEFPSMVDVGRNKNIDYADALQLRLSRIVQTCATLTLLYVQDKHVSLQRLKGLERGISLHNYEHSSVWIDHDLVYSYFNKGWWR